MACSFFCRFGLLFGFLTYVSWTSPAFPEDKAIQGKSTVHYDNLQSATSAALTNDGKFVAIGTSSGVLCIHRFEDGHREYITELAGGVYSLAISTNGKWLAAGEWYFNAPNSMQPGSIASVTLRDLKSGLIIWSHKAHKSIVHAVKFSPDNSVLASACSDNTIKLWDRNTGRILSTLPHNRIIYDVAFSPDGKQLLSVGSGNVITVWDLATRMSSILDVGHRGDIHAVLFSPDGKTVATAGEGNVVILWDWTSKKVVKRLSSKVTKGRRGILCIAFSPDGNSLVSGNTDGELVFWNRSNGERTRTVQKHRTEVHSVGYHPCGVWLVSTDTEGTVIQWNTESGIPTQVIRPQQK